MERENHERERDASGVDPTYDDEMAEEWRSEFHGIVNREHNRERIERLVRVVAAAKKADQLEREAQLERDDVRRITKLGDAYGARIDLGRALDKLQPGDIEDEQ